MVLEIARFQAVEGKAEELRAGLLSGAEVVRRAEGCRSVTVRRCIEDRSQFIFTIEWETLEAHTVTFRGGPLFAEYRGHINGLFVEPVAVNHYETVEA